MPVREEHSTLTFVVRAGVLDILSFTLEESKGIIS